MLRGAIIGLGNVALHGHVPGWLRRRDVEIIAVTDALPTRRAECEARLPGARWYDSVEELLADAPVDFADICTPPSSHAPLIRRALGRGVHVLCEKPLVCSLDEFRSVARLAAATHRVLHTVHNWHHAPMVRQIWEVLRRGEIGEVTKVVWHTFRTGPAAARDGHSSNWRVDPAVAGGGVLTDHGWHVFYILQRWLGERPTSVSARLETRRHAGWPVEDTATVKLTFPRATADVLLTWASDVRRNWAELAGTKGRVELRDDTLIVTRHGPGRYRHWSFSPPLSDGSHHADWFEPVANHFLAEMTDSRQGGANLAEASLCVALEALARESSRRGGQTLPLPMTSFPVPTPSAWPSL